jgi:hypothetical protein
LPGRACIERDGRGAAGVTNGEAFTDPAAAVDTLTSLFADDEVPVARYPEAVRLAHGTVDALPAVLSEVAAGQLAAPALTSPTHRVAGADHFIVLAAAASQVLTWGEEVL